MSVAYMGHKAAGRLIAVLCVLVILQRPRTQILDYGVILDAEPLLKHGKSPVLRPQGLIDIPPLKLPLKEFRPYLFQDALKASIVVKVWH